MSEATKLDDRDLDRLDVDEIRRFLARRWTLVVATMLACIVLAGTVCALLTPVYTATTQVLLDPRKQHVFGTETVNPDAALDSAVVDSQIPIILSNRILAKVIAREHLTDDPEFAAPARPGLLDRLFGAFRARRTANVEAPSVDGIDPALAPVILHLFNRVDVTRVAKSYVLSISVGSRDPGKAMRLANAIAETYVEDRIDVHAQSVQQAATFFEQRLGRLRDQVRESERAVAEYRKAHDLKTTSLDGKISVGEEQLKSLNEELAKISADTAEKLAKYQQAVRFDAKGASLETLPEVIRSPVIAQLRAQQADLTRRESDLASVYGPSYPAITQIHAQRDGLARAVRAEMKRLTGVLKNDYEVAKAREDSLRTTIAGLSDVSGGDNDVGVKLRELERANLANKALFENFLNRAKLTQEQSSFEEPDARLISPALEPTSPTSPKIKLILPLAAVIGLLLGLGLAAIVDAKRRRLVPTSSVSNDAFILGRVPFVNRPGRDADLSIYHDRYPTSEFALSIDALATKLAESAGTDGRVVTIAPLATGEGATSLALCLADSLGRTGKRVLLIDADIARRGLSRQTATSGKPGLSDVVAGKISASKAAQRHPHFTLLPAGALPLDVAARSKAMRNFLSDTRARFDMVLIDTCAFNAGATAAALGAVSDGFLLVASWDQLLKEPFIAAVDAVADKPGFLGIALNRTVPVETHELSMAS